MPGALPTLWRTSSRPLSLLDCPAQPSQGARKTRAQTEQGIMKYRSSGCSKIVEGAARAVAREKISSALQRTSAKHQAKSQEIEVISLEKSGRISFVWGLWL